MRLGIGVRFPSPNSAALAARTFARSRVGAGTSGFVALVARASSRITARPGLGSVPVITAASFTIGTNPGFNALVGVVAATNSPTSFAITSGNSSGYFSIASNGTLRTGGSAAPPDNNYSLQITATNSFGTSQPVTIPVTVGAAPQVVDQSMNLQLPASSGANAGNVAVSNGTPTSFSITAGNSSGYFAIDNAGSITVTAAGASGITAQTYSLTVQASNALGNSTGTISVVASSGTQQPAAFRSVAAVTYASRTNTTVNIPPGAVNGDILVAAIVTVASGTAPTPTAPAGWTAIGAPTTVTDGGNFNGKLFAFWKRANNEGSTFTFTHTASSSQAFIAAYSGCVTNGSPIDASSANASNGLNGLTATATGVTTTAPNDIVMFVEHNWDILAVTPPSTTVERFEGLLYLSDYSASTAGPTGNLVTTANGNNDSASPWAALLIALKSNSTTLVAPQVVSASFNLPLPAASGAGVGTVTTTGGVASSFAITGGNTAGYFAINSAGLLSVTSAGAAGLTTGSFPLTITATNASGSGSGTVTVAASTSIARMGWELNASNTGLAGAGVDRNSLTLYTGPTTPAAGTTISLKKITSGLLLYNGNITLDRCLIQPTSSDGSGGIIFTFDPNVGNSASAPSLVTIKDCDIDASLVTNTSIYADCAIRGACSVYRCNIYGMGTGIAIYDATGMPNIVIENNFIHDLRGGLYGSPSQQSHNEAATIRSFGGTSCVWRGNWFESTTGSDSAALFFQAQGVIRNVLVENCYLNTLGFYELGLEAASGGYSNMQSNNNRFVVRSGTSIGYVSGGTGWTTWTNNYVYNASNPPTYQGAVAAKP